MTLRAATAHAGRGVPPDIRVEFLAELAVDGTAFVEVLRASAAYLDGTAPAASPELAEKVRAHLATALRSVAARLCDHARVADDGTCRYCERPPRVSVPECAS